MNSPRLHAFHWGFLVVFLLASFPADAATPTLTGSFVAIPQGSNVDLTVVGPLDWVHWGLYTETSLDRKAGVTSLISDFTVLDAPNGYAYAYEFADNYNGYSWNDGTPTLSVTNTTTGVWTYSVPTMGSGFQFTVPADTTLRTLKVYVGAFSARGKFEAFLSDNSAPAYTNAALVNHGNGESGVYSISYAAQSTGQRLTIKWSLSQGFAADANVTLQAAALSAPGANNPPTVAITSPRDNANFSAGSNITISADASDTDGAIAKVEFFQGDAKLGESTSNPYTLTWSNATAGNFSLTARASDEGGATRTSASVEIFVNGTGGTLSGSVTLPATSVDLTAESTPDWAHWGLSSSTDFDHKTGVPQQISNFAKIGTNDTQRLQDYYTAFSWSDGTPTAGTNGTKTGVFVHGLTNGFLLTAPADTNSRTVKVYVGLYGAEGKFQSYLSDYSAPAYTDTSLSSIYGNDPAVYTLTYAAASSRQTLVVKYTAQTLFDADYGNVTLQAATLSVGSLPTNAPPTVAITSPTNNASFTAPAYISIEADASDVDGTISKVDFYSGTTLLGTATNSPYAFVWSGVPAGNYTVTARATDNLGDTATSTAFNIAVTNRTTTAVTILNPTWNGNEFSFSFATAAGSAYAIEYKDSLNLISWQSLTNFAGNGTTLSVTNITTTTERFYRVAVQ